ncbi:MAG: adenylate kinase [Candidatus Thorarchaeota archaeon]|nr:MAG: adenylate kinase [Candidatus Thorarchaeota archaeon]RLI60057.1 MAG: adenylate kinase [Candidatus Thorarchaeota archaeon]
MSDARNAVIVTGIPGVGKTTVIDTAVKMVKDKHNEEVPVLNFGTAMFEVASGRGLVEDRDEMRRLPTVTQREVQQLAGEAIAKRAESAKVIVDTHTLILTPNGFLIGLPEWVVRAIKPKTIVLVEADPEDIARRRSDDSTRARDVQMVEDIDTHQKMCRSAAVAAATLTGATVRIIKNRQGKVEEAATQLYETLME